MASIYIAAAHKSSGKTIVSLGLCAALRSTGYTVQPFKKGPDYIDPIWLSQAAGRPCYNLDFYTMGHSQIHDTVAAQATGADIIVIEGNKGLYDGMDLHGKDSNAALAGLLGVPVVLVLDTRGMTRGIAPLVLGYRTFEPRVNIAGVILNQVGGMRHESKLRAALREYTDVPVLGVLHKDSQLIIEERHLGLIPSSELECAARKIEQIKILISNSVDLDHLVRIAREQLAFSVPESSPDVSMEADIRVGLPRDAAFGFYYPDDLKEMRTAGAELVFFDSLHDRSLPNVDGLFIGGGFPETQMEKLEANRSLRADILHFVKQGGPVYAECGGLIYLGRRLKWRDRSADMVGALPLDVVMREHPVGRGYVNLTETGKSPWGSIVADGSDRIHAHEFHHSKVEKLDAPDNFAYRVQRGFGIDGEYDGLIYQNVIASYAHLRTIDPICWAQKFVGFVRQCAH